MAMIRVPVLWFRLQNGSLYKFPPMLGTVTNIYIAEHMNVMILKNGPPRHWGRRMGSQKFGSSVSRSREPQKV